MAYLPNEDRLTKALITIDYPHHEIHEGDHFFYTDCLTLASGATQDYMVTVPVGVYPHMSFEFEGSAITALDVYRYSDKTGTTLQTIFNNNFNSSNTTTMTIHKGTSGGTTDGTKVWCHNGGTSTGASSSSGIASKTDNEMILKDGKYIFRLTSGTAGNLCNIKFGWYQ